MRSDITIHAGGLTANNLTQVARLGAKSAWLGLIGDDENGQIIKKAFTDEGMDIAGVEVVKGERSSFTWIPVNIAGDHCVYMFPNITGKISVHQVRSRFAPFIQTAKHFHTEASQIGIAPIKEAMRIAKEANVRVFFDLDVTPNFFAQANLGRQDEVCDCLRMVNVLKPSKRAARELTGESDYERIATRLLGLGPEHDCAEPGSGRLLDGQSQRKSPCSGLPRGCGGLGRRRRGIHGWPFLWPVAGVGSSANRRFRECVFGPLLHADGLARHVKARRGVGVHQVEECGRHAGFCLIPGFSMHAHSRKVSLSCRRSNGRPSHGSS